MFATTFNVPPLNVCQYKINAKRGKFHFIDRITSSGNGEVEQELGGTGEIIS